MSKSTLLATRPSQLAPKKCINKSIWLATGGHLPWVHHRYLPGANQIDLFMHFLGASRDGLVARRVDLDTISSSENNTRANDYGFNLDLMIMISITCLIS